MPAFDTNIRPQKAGNASLPVVTPVPGWLFFLEALPATGDAKTDAKPSAKDAARVVADHEALVQLSLESHAPLPLDYLAYGWLANAAGLIYYATTRERLRQFFPDTESSLFLLPDFLLAPKPASSGAWVWVATTAALTAVRFAETADGKASAPALLEEIRSWPWPETGAAANAEATSPAENSPAAGPSLDTPADAGKDSPPVAETSPDADVAAVPATEGVPAGKTPALAPASALPEPFVMRQLRASLEAGLSGVHNPGIFIWNGASIDRSRKTLLASWAFLARDGSTSASPAVAFPVDAAWNADVRERVWLARERKTRAGVQRANRLLRAAALVWLVVLAAFVGLHFQERAVDAAATRAAVRQNEVNAIKARAETLQRLDEIHAGEISNPNNSFYDALAICNHLRPQSILFTQASFKGRRTITITGTANSVQEVSTYVTALRQKVEGDFESVTEKSTHSAGNTNFDLTIVVKDLSRVTRGTPFTEEEQELLRPLLAPSPAAAAPATPPVASPATESAPTAPRTLPATLPAPLPSAPAPR